jgi:hypothetical protein
MKIKKKLPKKPRSLETLTAILSCKGGRMRHRADRRPDDARRSWRKESW